MIFFLAVHNRRRAERKLSIPALALGAAHATNDAPLVTMRDNAPDLGGVILQGCEHSVPPGRVARPGVNVPGSLNFEREGERK